MGSRLENCNIVVMSLQTQEAVRAARALLEFTEQTIELPRDLICKLTPFIRSLMSRNVMFVLSARDWFKKTQFGYCVSARRNPLSFPGVIAIKVSYSWSNLQNSELILK